MCVVSCAYLTRQNTSRTVSKFPVERIGERGDSHLIKARSRIAWKFVFGGRVPKARPLSLDRRAAQNAPGTARVLWRGKSEGCRGRAQRSASLRGRTFH